MTLTNKILLFITIPLIGLQACSQGEHSTEEHEHSTWNYEGETGPSHWAELNPKYFDCAVGKNQSPIDIHDLVEANIAPIKFNYQPGGHQIINNGHTVQINYKPGSRITVDQQHSYQLKQIHFHSPSENTINGRSFPMEAHFVHSDEKGHLAVVAVMIEAGKNKAMLQEAWQNMPIEINSQYKLTKLINAAEFFPDTKAYYRYSGSLTTPPCSEGVLWLVLKSTTSLSKEQISTFQKVIKHPNNRPLQDLNSRIIVQ